LTVNLLSLCLGIFSIIAILTIEVVELYFDFCFSFLHIRDASVFFSGLVSAFSVLSFVHETNNRVFCLANESSWF